MNYTRRFITAGAMLALFCIAIASVQTEAKPPSIQQIVGSSWQVTIPAGSTAQQINDCFTDAETVGGYHEFTFEPGIYDLDSTVFLPTEIPFSINGYGATLANAKVERLPDNHNHAKQMLERRVQINGLQFQNGGLVLGAAAFSRIEDCHAKQCDIGFDFPFFLVSHANQCRATNCGIGFHVVSGERWGVSKSASSSNVAVLNGCRVYNPQGAVGYLIRNSDSVRLENCVSEGKAVQYHVDFSDEGSHSVCKQFSVDNFHAEAACDAIFRIKKNTGVVSINHVDRAALSGALVDPTGCKAGMILSISNVAYSDNAGGPFFKHNGDSYRPSYRMVWDLRNVYRATDPARWENNQLPYAYYMRGGKANVWTETKMTSGEINWLNVPNQATIKKAIIETLEIP